jgi:prevent-host-death family protein
MAVPGPRHARLERRAGPNTEDQDTWPVETARANFARLIDGALSGRPQRIRRRGKDVVVVLAAEDYDRLVAPRDSLVDFFRNSPLAEAMAAGEIDLDRDRDEIRDLDL